MNNTWFSYAPLSNSVRTSFQDVAATGRSLPIHIQTGATAKPDSDHVPRHRRPDNILLGGVLSHRLLPVPLQRSGRGREEHTGKKLNLVDNIVPQDKTHSLSQDYPY